MENDLKEPSEKGIGKIRRSARGNKKFFCAIRKKNKIDLSFLLTVEALGCSLFLRTENESKHSTISLKYLRCVSSRDLKKKQNSREAQ